MAIRAQMEGLIKLALAVRALQSVRMKLFIRPDMADDRRLWEVGDASKLRHRAVPLAWRRRDLYGLLWTLLANSPDDDESRGGGGFQKPLCQNIRRHIRLSGQQLAATAPAC